MNHHLRRAIVATALVAFVATQVAAASVIPPTFAELVGAATDIFVGEVVTTECRWVSTPGGPVIVTNVTFAIEESLKGVSRGQTTLQFRGGRIGDVTLTVADMPAFRVRDRDVLFVGDRGAVSPLVGFMHGRFPIERDASGVERVRTHDRRPLKATAALGIAGSPPPDAAPGLSLLDLRSEVLTRLRAQRPVR